MRAYADWYTSTQRLGGGCWDLQGADGGVLVGFTDGGAEYDDAA